MCNPTEKFVMNNNKWFVGKESESVNHFLLFGCWNEEIEKKKNRQILFPSLIGRRKSLPFPLSLPALLLKLKQEHIA